MSKYERILTETWDALESCFMSSEISFSLYMYSVCKKCDNDYCLKRCLKLLWEQWEFDDLEDKKYYKTYFKECFGIRVV